MGCEGELASVVSPDVVYRAAKSAFRYDKETDTYECPKGQRLSPAYATKVGNTPLMCYANLQGCQECTIRERCTKSWYRSIVRYVNEAVLERMAERLAKRPELLNRRGECVEHPFGSIKQWMGQGAFLMQRLENVRDEFSLRARARGLAGRCPSARLRQCLRIYGGSDLTKSMV